MAKDKGLSRIKAGRAHKKVVNEATRKHGNAATDADATPMSPRLIERHGETFKHLAKTINRHGA